MDQDILSSTANTKNKEVASQRKQMYIQSPVRLVFIIGLFHIVVSVIIASYLLYKFMVYGYVPTLIVAVLMIWIVGALLIMSLAYIGKDLIKYIIRICG